MDIVVNPLAGVAANSKASGKWNNLLGYTIDRVIYTLGGTFTKAQITNVKVQANGKTIVEDTGSRIDTRMQHRGITAAAAYLVLDFAEIRARTIQGQKVGCLDTVSSGIRDLNVEIDIGGATSPTLSAIAQVSAAPQNDPSYSGLIAKVLSYTQNFGAAGEFPVDIPFGKQAGSFIKRAHFFGSTVTAARVKKNGIEVWNRNDALNDFVLGEYQRTPQANCVCIDFIEDGNLSNVHNAANANTHEWYVTVSGAGNVTVVMELLDPLVNN